MHHSVRSAVAAALAMGAASAAYALPPAEVTGTITTLYISGATATNNTLQNLFKLASAKFCVPGSLDIYTQTNQYVAFCSASVDSGVTGKIALLKESNGGSANGIRNVANIPGSGASALNFINFTSSNLAANCAVATLVTATTDFAQHNTRACTAPTGFLAAVVPEAGVTDIDPDTFVGTAGVTQAEANALINKTRSVGVMFSPIVSTNLYLALQKAQGLISAGATTIDDSSVNTVPTMTSAQLRGIFAGQLVLPSQIWSAGASVGADQVQLTTLTSANSGLVHLCRRADTSGTMTSFKLHFLGEGCSKNSGSIAAFQLADEGNTALGAQWNATVNGDDLVFAGAGSGDTRNCMDFHSVNGNYAVGVASTESKPGTTAGTRWRYVRTDGQLPSLTEVLRGNYDFVTENSLTDKGLTGTDATLWANIKADIGNTAAVAGTNSGFRNSLAITATGDEDDGIADTGVLGIPDASNPLQQPSFPISKNEGRSTPISSMSRQLSSSPNNCNMSIQVIPTSS